ncbi:DUF255 domain-containing protein [Dictyobacter aurantiacus]|uniref:Spermatogenesis-associated protein 20-like TRX domain-containing protein n=1 Tax=Dictyobacter aurantiacus TaxID=1936993 RepID=A0A401Z8U3_9CHLR|nr:DUF255 domain-containing protein [Dictyobacter aurantiacus]GCE03281.1 hypothetical protein KDAU_06100 [Dictyobacter aurantiacus]
MSGNVIASNSWSFASMPAVFRYSSHPNQAHKIHWRAWSKAAFDEAIQADKPIFLLISSVWSQGCQLMDETTLSEARVIDVINADYIPIRVDSDLRPDINQRYNQNGWPSVLLLSAEGEILWGGMYVPATTLLYYLGYIRRYYADHGDEISAQASELQEQRRTRALTQTLAGYDLRPLELEEQLTLQELPAAASSILIDLYDHEQGGFTIHPHLKFPHPDALELLLKDAGNYELVRYSLVQMRDGGLWDHEEGGFFRYSAASDWSMPHTEKMLDENAAMLRLLVLTAQASGDHQWSELARQLIAYINTTLWQPDKGIFSGSQCADEEYYEPGMYSRASRIPPQVDHAIYTSWNARMISSYLLAAQVLEDASLSIQALQALDYLCTHLMHRDGSMLHYAIDGQASLPGQLADQVWMTQALLDAYAVSGSKHHLETAIALMHFSCQELLDPDSGLFYDYPTDPQAIGRLAIREQPLTENALAASCLLRMSAYSQRKHLHDTAMRVLMGCMHKYYRTGILGTSYACVVAQAIEQGWL